MAPIINFSGIASGIDSSSLISAVLDQQRKARISPLQDRISFLAHTNESFDHLSSLLSELKSAAYNFRAISGGAIAKNASSSNETVASASTSNAAQAGSYTLSVSQMASAATYSFADRFTSGSGIINSSINNGASSASRTVTVSTGQGSNQEDVNIELTNTTTASEFVTQFNSQSNKAEATLVNVGTAASPSYAVVISGNSSGLEEGEVTVSVGSEIQTAGSGAFVTASSTVTQAQNSQFSISGIAGTIERSTNTISDLVSGVTFNLSSVGNSTITVLGDSESTKGSIKKFVDSYNEVVQYIQENDLTSQDNQNGEIVNIFGSFSDTSIDNNVLSQLRSSLVSSRGTGGTVNMLADIGITTQRDGTLGFNETTFKDAFASDPQGVGTVTENLGETLASVGGVIDQYTRFNGIIGIAKYSNSQSIDSMYNQITTLEEGLARQQDAMTSQFSRLESLIGKLNQQQSTLSAILPR